MRGDWKDDAMRFEGLDKAAQREAEATLGDVFRGEKARHEASRARAAVKQAIAKVIAAMDDLDDAVTDYDINAPEADRTIIEAVDKALNANGYAFRDGLIEAKKDK